MLIECKFIPVYSSAFKLKHKEPNYFEVKFNSRKMSITNIPVKANGNTMTS